MAKKPPWKVDAYQLLSSRQIFMARCALDMRIEWCKAQARAKQWSEEVELLSEKMRRTLLFFQWDAAHWEER